MIKIASWTNFVINEYENKCTMLSAHYSKSISILKSDELIIGYRYFRAILNERERGREREKRDMTVARVYVRGWLLQEHTCVYVCAKYYKFLFANRLPFDLIRYKNTWHIFFQLLDTLPVCQDFNRQVCNRPACKFIHLSDGELFVIGKYGLSGRARFTFKISTVSVKWQRLLWGKKCSMFGPQF